MGGGIPVQPRGRALGTAPALVPPLINLYRRLLSRGTRALVLGTALGTAPNLVTPLINL